VNLLNAVRLMSKKLTLIWCKRFIPIRGIEREERDLLCRFPVLLDEGTVRLDNVDDDTVT
jgi:hypothetical protein